jgi:hypothetical protein
MKVNRQVELVAKKTGKSISTIWRWRKDGCDISSSASLKQFLQSDRRRRNSNAVRKSENENISAEPVADPQESEHVSESDLNLIELGPIGPKGAAAALQRLEEIEERAHARLMRAIENGNQFQVKSAQEFYLRTSETLRRLDLAVETERRNSEEQVPKKQVESVSLYLAEWLRIAFAQFLSSESRSLMGIRDPAEFRLYATDRFRGIVFAAVKTSRKTNSPIPTWAEEKVIEGFGCSGCLVDCDVVVRKLNPNVIPKKNTFFTPGNRTDTAALRNNKPHAAGMGIAISKH